MRTPEIWRELGCSHRSDVWSLAATVLVWLKPGILGFAGAKDDLWPSLWCMTKIMGLFPGWTALPARTETIRKEAIAAKLLLDTRDLDRPKEMYMNVHPLDDELQTMSISDELSNLLRYLLVPDPEKRPSAVDVLNSPQYQALLRVV